MILVGQGGLQLPDNSQLLHPLLLTHKFAYIMAKLFFAQMAVSVSNGSPVKESFSSFKSLDLLSPRFRIIR